MSSFFISKSFDLYYLILELWFNAINHMLSITWPLKRFRDSEINTLDFSITSGIFLCYLVAGHVHTDILFCLFFTCSLSFAHGAFINTRFPSHHFYRFKSVQQTEMDGENLRNVQSVQMSRMCEWADLYFYQPVKEALEGFQSDSLL